jgi:hypothetical protein
MSVVGTAAAVLTDGAAELGHHDNKPSLPFRAKRILHWLQAIGHPLQRTLRLLRAAHTRSVVWACPDTHGRAQCWRQGRESARAVQAGHAPG